jgi:hypothetical protein
VFWVLRLVEGVHTRFREKSVNLVQGLHLNSLSSSEKSVPGGHTRTTSTSEEGKIVQGVHIRVVEHSEEDIHNTLRDKKFKECASEGAFKSSSELLRVSGGEAMQGGHKSKPLL